MSEENSLPNGHGLEIEVENNSDTIKDYYTWITQISQMLIPMSQFMDSLLANPNYQDIIESYGNDLFSIFAIISRLLWQDCSKQF